MHISLLNAMEMLGMSAPFLAIVAVVAHYHLRRASWKRKRRAGRFSAGFCPSSAALGTAFLFMPLFYRPSLGFEIEARQVQYAEEDDEGDPETPERHLNRQLRQVRRGKPIDTLVVRLSQVR